MQPLRQHWGLFLAEGIILVILGLAAILLPAVATLTIAIFLGWLLLISGVVGLATTLIMRSAPGFSWSLLSAFLAIIVGIALIAFPLSGAISLTILLIVFFWVEGVATILFAFDHRRELSGRWGWMLLSGVVDLVLGIVLLTGFPGSALWAIGLLLGINMIFGGAALMSMALHARSTNPA